MGASNFGRTNLPSGIIYAFGMAEEANKQFDLLLQDEAGEGMEESDRDFNVEIFMDDNYRNTIDNVEELLSLNSYSSQKWDGDKKIIGYVNIILFNHESKEWECGSINVLVEHGYYEGARLDISIDDLVDNFPPLNKSQTALINREIARIEKVFARVCESKYRKVGSFSNGEGVYESV